MKGFAIGAVWLISISSTITAGAQATEGPTDAREFERFVDSVVTTSMAAERIPGAAFCFVRDGRVFLCKGYGYADLARKKRVSADSTIFRIGSISKVITSTALVQLADRGRIDLTVDVNRYLRRVKVPAAFGRFVTGEQLLDHTAGFDEVRPGTQAPSAETIAPLADFLRSNLRRVRPPGETISYSTYGITLAGNLVEEISGLSFEAYVGRNILAPLGMSRTNVTVPQRLQSDVAVGYELGRDSTAVPARWEWYHTYPASSFNSTAADMGRFIIANLQLGRVNGSEVLSERAARYMLRQHFTMHPRLPGFALGFYEDYVGDLRILQHGGNVEGFSAQLVLIPDERSGFFVVNHHEQSQLRDILTHAILTRFYSKARARQSVPPPPRDFPSRASAYVGQYSWTTSCHTCSPPTTQIVMTVSANPNGTLSFSGRQWIEVAPSLFVRDDGASYISFRADSDGKINLLSAGEFWTFERIP